MLCSPPDDSFGKPEIEDDCSLYSTAFEDLILVDETCFRKVQRTWFVLGECDSLEVAQSVFIKIELDETPPTFANVPTDTILSCTDSLTFFDPIISDECDANLDIQFTESSEFGDCIYEETITRTWTATDDCGNVNTFVQNIQILDTLGPIFSGIPSNLQLECDEPIPNDAPVVTDNCTPDVSIEVNMSEVVFAGACTGQQRISRTWVATDLCGNSSFFSQSINIVDTTAPFFLNVPQDTIISCEMELPQETPVVGDNCTEPIVLDFNETIEVGTCSQESIITRTWTAEDDCGNVDSVVQVISVIDDTPPIFLNPPSDVTVGCKDMLPFYIPLVQDECGTDFSVIETRDTMGSFCELIITRTWTAGDACGNTSTVQQEVTKLDNNPPQLSNILNVDVDLFEGCSSRVNLLTPMVEDDCSEDLDITITIDFYSDGIVHNTDFVRNDTTFVNGNPSGEFPLGRHSIFYSAVDDCGNERTAISIVNIKDVRPPVSGCFNFELELQPDSTVSIVVDELLNMDATFDNCTDIWFEFGVQFPQIMLLGDTLTFDCSDLGINNYSIYIEDTFGNFDFCGNVLNIVDPNDYCGLASKQPIVAGKVYTENQKGVANTEIMLNENAQSMTDDYGVYYFEHIERGTTCIIEPQSPDDYLNGVSTFDLVLIQRHVLGIQTLPSPYKMLAADINQSGNVSTADIVELRQVILNIQTSFPNSDSWIYLNSNQTFDNPSNPFEEAMQKKYVCKNITGSHLNLDFTAIKIGDVDDSASLNAFTENSQERHAKSLLFASEVLEEQDYIILDFYTENPVDIQAFQFTLNWETDLLEIIDFIPKQAMTRANFGTSKLEKGILTSSWNGLESIKPFEVLFSLKMRVRQNTNLKDALQMTSQHTKAEAYQSDGTTWNIELLTNDIDLPETTISTSTETVALEEKFVLTQNQPNPFGKQTLIQFYVEQPCATTFQLMDLTGKVLMRETIEAQQAWNDILLYKDQLPQAGVYIYQVQNEWGSQTKKLMLVE